MVTRDRIGAGTNDAGLDHGVRSKAASRSVATFAPPENIDGVVPRADRGGSWTELARVIPKLTPRKAPRQPRARATVDAIIEAAEQLTRNQGVEAWTTNHVAERAGVSIGTLYQYFPNKESLLTTLYVQRRAARLDALATAMSELGARGAGRAAARAVARAWLDGDWPLELAVRAQLIAIGATRKLVDVDEQALRLVRQVAARGGVAEAVAARRGFMVLHAIEGAIATAVRDHPAWLADEALVDDVAALVSALRET